MEDVVNYKKGRIGKRKLLDLYEGILKPRLIEEKMLILLRQGKISKWFSGIGQEAISVGSTMALADDDFILPMHRNLGVFTSRKIPLGKLFAQLFGKVVGFTKGRERSFHFGAVEYHIVGMISHLGAQLGVADGIALAQKLSKNGRISLVYSGEGGTSEGDFHEAVNVAAVWDLPVIFLIENNGYALSTPTNEQYRFKSFVDKGPGYGIDALRINGNDIVEVYDTIKGLAAKIRKRPRPVLVEATTFRMRGHEEASGIKYVPGELMESWSAKDPFEMFEAFLIREGLIDEKYRVAKRKTITKEIEDGLKYAFDAPAPVRETNPEEDIFAPHSQTVVVPSNGTSTKKRLVDAISDALRQSLEKYPNLVFMGQDIAEYGGVFKVSEGFVELFGKDRIRNTPICESSILGMGLGMTIGGYKSVIEMQFADFVSCGFNQIVNNLAKVHYRWGQNADVVIRMPTGAGVGAGPFHSQSNEAWFFHTPGLKIVFPSNPYDAKGLLAASIEDPNPVLFFEHKFLYRSVSDDIPDEYYTLALGKAMLVDEGDDMSIITYGAGVHWAKETISEMHVSADILDLRTLMPVDYEAVSKTVIKTGKVLILHEDTLTGGIGGELAAWIGENHFEALDGPVFRVASLDTPVPFAATLEENFLPKGRLKDKIKELLDF